MSPTAAEATQVQIESPPEPPPSTPSDASPTLAATAEKPVARDAPAKKSKRARSKSAESAPAASDGPSVAAHPRAARAVSRAKGWGGLGGFLLAGYLSLPTGTLAEAALRALVAGSVCYVAAWGGAVFLWRRLVMIEIKGREQRLAAIAQPAGATGESPAMTERAGARAAS
jgi:hypothetical protein